MLQLGGSDPGKLAAAARIAARYGYDEVNLNCGCPSDRVAGAGCFGAALMLRPEVVAAGCAAMRAALGDDTPVTVKCRLGADDVDSYEALCNFVGVVSAAGGVRHFIIHARKCLLKGLSPHQNRTVPPLRCAAGAGARQRAPHGAAPVSRVRLCSTCLPRDTLLGRRGLARLRSRHTARVQRPLSDAHSGWGCRGTASSLCGDLPAAPPAPARAWPRARAARAARRREWVWALKRDFPHLAFSLNGQVEGCHAAAAALATPVPAAPALGEQPVLGEQSMKPAPQPGPGAAPEAGPGGAPEPGPGGAGRRLEGVMIGRAAYSAPWAALANADVAVWGAPANAAACRRQARPPSALNRPRPRGAGRGPAGAGVRAGGCAAAAALRCCRAGPAETAPAARRARRSAARQRGRARARRCWSATRRTATACWAAGARGRTAAARRACARWPSRCWACSTASPAADASAARWRTACAASPPASPRSCRRARRAQVGAPVRPSGGCLGYPCQPLSAVAARV